MENKVKPISFFDSVSPFVKLSIESKKILLAHMVKESLPKGHVLVPIGGICRNVHYIEKGLSRTFYLKEGKEVTERFCAENSFTCSMTGHLTNTPDGRQIELLEPSVIWSMPYEKLEQLYDNHHEIERLGRHIITADLIALQSRLSDLQFKTAEERYINLLKSNPTLLQRAPLGIISSYLGITQETLSRIRSKVI
jgi:CRP-like cAMP-binding protein